MNHQEYGWSALEGKWDACAERGAFCGTLSADNLEARQAFESMRHIFRSDWARDRADSRTPVENRCSMWNIRSWHERMFHMEHRVVYLSCPKRILPVASPEMGSVCRQSTSGSADRSSGSVPVVTKSTNQLSGTIRAKAILQASAILSTARSVTMEKYLAGGSSSMRPSKISAFSSRERSASRRKAAFFPCDSPRVTLISGRQMAIGIPGRPAPEPKSSNVGPSGNA